ncbi:MAG: hypothetical protein AAFR83_23215 [Cyanobacteria bacterium J06629_18]
MNLVKIWQWWTEANNFGKSISQFAVLADKNLSLPNLPTKSFNSGTNLPFPHLADLSGVRYYYANMRTIIITIIISSTFRPDLLSG